MTCLVLYCDVHVKEHVYTSSEAQRGKHAPQCSSLHSSVCAVRGLDVVCGAPSLGALSLILRSFCLFCWRFDSATVGFLDGQRDLELGRSINLAVFPDHNRQQDRDELRQGLRRRVPITKPSITTSDEPQATPNASTTLEDRASQKIAPSSPRHGVCDFSPLALRRFETYLSS